MAKLRENPDMPYFLLLASDPRSAALVWLWASMRELSDDQNLDKVNEARRACVEIMEWQAANGRKASGFGQALMSGLLEMCRTINSMAKEEPKNEATPLDVVRRYLAAVEFGDEEQLRKASEDERALSEVIGEYDRVIEGILPAVLAEDGDEADFVIRAKDYRILKAAALKI
jgi:hypothetical protein